MSNQTPDQIELVAATWVDQQADLIMGSFTSRASLTSQEVEVVWRAVRQGVREVLIARMATWGVDVPAGFCEPLRPTAGAA